MPEVETISFGHWTQKAPIYSGYREQTQQSSLFMCSRMYARKSVAFSPSSFSMIPKALAPRKMPLAFSFFTPTAHSVQAPPPETSSRERLIRFVFSPRSRFSSGRSIVSVFSAGLTLHHQLRGQERVISGIEALLLQFDLLQRRQVCFSRTPSSPTLQHAMPHRAQTEAAHLDLLQRRVVCASPPPPSLTLHL